MTELRTNLGSVLFVLGGHLFSDCSQDVLNQGEIARDVLENNGGGCWTRTNDLRIMSSISDSDSKQNQVVSSAESGKVGQNPQPRRNLNSIPEDDGKEEV